MGRHRLFLPAFVFALQIAVGSGWQKAQAAVTLSEIRERIEEQKKAIAKGEASRESIQKFLEISAREQRQIMAGIRSAQDQMRTLRMRVARSGEEAEQAESARLRLRDGAEKAALPIVAVGEGGLLKILFGRAEYGEIVVADLAMRHWLQRASDHVRAYAVAAQKADAARRAAEQAAAEIAGHESDLKHKQETLAASEHSQQLMLANLRSELNLYRQTLAGLQEEERQLQDLLARQPQVNRGQGMPLSRTPLSPLPVQQIRSFGSYRDHPTGLVLQSTGVLYFAEKGTPILATAEGEVVFADWFRGYGWMIILAHQGGYFTLYAHCSELNVKTGARVKVGERIADSGDSGSLDGPSIYFEVRKGKDPVDPAGWLQR